MGFTSTRRARFAAPILLWIGLAVPSSAQIPLPDAFGPAAPTPAPAETPRDPLGRSTPRGTITSFIRAAHGNNLASAVMYMQVPEKQQANAEALARGLNELMDRYFEQRVITISDTPEGTPDDGLPLDREKVGPLVIAGKSFDVGLVRVDEPDGNKIWLISAETVAQIPALHASIETPLIERVLPASLTKQRIIGKLSWAQLGAWAASLAIPFVLFWLISLVAIRIARRKAVGPVARRRVETLHAGLRWPAIFVLTLVIHFATLTFFGFSLRFRILYAHIVAVALLLSIAWLLQRIMAISFEYMRGRMLHPEQAGARSLTLLGERVLHVVLVLVTGFFVLTVAGVPSTTLLAGVGIVGVALAIGARQTVENFLGGVFLLSDKALAVGDLCRISEHVGYVEDITLRSVRLRTLEQTLLSIPAGRLAQDTVENFTTRGKILLRTTLRLRYGSSLKQVRAVLAEITKLLDASPKIEKGTQRVRLVDFGVRGIELELFAYVLTSDALEFLAEREELLLQIAGIVEAAGSGFARPDASDAPPEPTPRETQGAL